MTQGTTPAPTGPVAGWYPDPVAEADLRWWDGSRWTLHQLPPATAHLPASWPTRVYGYLADAVILWALSLVLFQPIHRRLSDEVSGLLVSDLTTGAGSLLNPALWWNYGLVQTWLVVAIPGVLLRIVWDLAWLTRRGATFGHRRAALRVHGDAHPGAKALHWQTVLVRSVVMRVSAPLVLPWLLVMLWPLVDHRGRTLADVAAGTWVEGP